MNGTSDSNLANLTIRRVGVRLYRSGGVIPDQSGWPFVRISISPDLLNIKLFGTDLSLTPENITRLEEYWQAYVTGHPVNEHGLRATLAGPVTTSSKLPPITGVDMAFRSKDFDKVVELLRRSGFLIDAAQASPSTEPQPSQ